MLYLQGYFHFFSFTSGNGIKAFPPVMDEERFFPVEQS